MQKRTFIRSFYLSSVIVLCLILGSFSAAKAYENMRLSGFGEYKRAVEYNGSKWRIFDFEFSLKKG